MVRDSLPDRSRQFDGVHDAWRRRLEGEFIVHVFSTLFNEERDLRRKEGEGERREGGEGGEGGGGRDGREEKEGEGGRGGRGRRGREGGEGGEGGGGRELRDSQANFSLIFRLNCYKDCRLNFHGF